MYNKKLTNINIFVWIFIFNNKFGEFDTFCLYIFQLYTNYSITPRNVISQYFKLCVLFNIIDIK